MLYRCVTTGALTEVILNSKGFQSNHQVWIGIDLQAQLSDVIMRRSNKAVQHCDAVTKQRTVGDAVTKQWNIVTSVCPLHWGWCLQMSVENVTNGKNLQGRM